MCKKRCGHTGQELTASISDACVWVGESEKVPGFVTEADALEAVPAKLPVLIPELLEANWLLPPNGETFPLQPYCTGPRPSSCGLSPSMLPKEYGCWLERQRKGDHEIWFSPRTGPSFPADRKINSRHTANGILRQAGLSKAF